MAARRWFIGSLLIVCISTRSHGQDLSIANARVTVRFHPATGMFEGVCGNTVFIQDGHLSGSGGSV